MVIFLRDHNIWRYRLFDLMNKTTASHVLGIPNSLQYLEKIFRCMYISSKENATSKRVNETSYIVIFFFSPFVRMRPLGKGESSLLLAIGFCFLCKTLFYLCLSEALN